jgi:hypothetical protein
MDHCRGAVSKLACWCMKSVSKIKEAVAMSMSQFLAAELEIAKTLIHIARSADDSSKRKRSIFYARRAYEAVQEFLPRSPVKDSENIEIRQALDSLRPQLEALGETFEEPALAQLKFRRHSGHSGLSRLSTREKPVKVPSSPRAAHPDAAREVKRFLIECRRLRAQARQIRTQNKIMMERKRRTVPAANPQISPTS